MTVTQLVIRYSAFAVVATVINLATQRALLAVYTGSYPIPLAIFVGTVVGLVVKFYLDKNWIFKDVSTSASANTRKFMLYTVMGLATTLIFWGMEYGFWLIWGTDLMREVGAVLGLSIGYVTKYHLDKRFVFDTPALRPAI
jgi:putative flippase GtrA